MENNPLWVIETKHIDPNDFYVKVDGSPFYTAFWVARAADPDIAQALLNETAEELVLGETTVISTIPFNSENMSIASEVMEKINARIVKLGKSDDIRLAAWITSTGGLW